MALSVLNLHKEWLQPWRGPLKQRLHGCSHGEIIKGGGIYSNVGLQLHREHLLSLIIFLYTNARRLCPACEAAYAVSNGRLLRLTTSTCAPATRIPSNRGVNTISALLCPLLRSWS